jgi:hypothetical protein
MKPDKSMEKMRWAIFGCGPALFIVAVVGIGLKWDSKYLWILVAAGAACLLIGYVGHRLTRVKIKHGDTTFDFTLATEVREDLKVTGLAGAAGIYSFIHNQLGDDRNSYKVKVKLQDDVVRMVKANAFNHKVDAAEVDEVLSSGSPAERVLVFGLLEGDARLATVERLRQGILDSRSGNEQYHAFLATSKHWDTFTDDQKAELRGYIEGAQHYKGDRDREELVAKILAPSET